ncbi:MAG: RHS repeat-associated core domain-containing protein, partial [Chthoniobacterales bacterium]
VPVQLLTGDINGDGVVKSDDADLAMQSSGQTTDETNFRADINMNGMINATDKQIVNGSAGNSVPDALSSSVAVTVNYTPDSDGQVGRLHLSGARFDLGYQYDDARRLKRITAGASGPTLYEYSYDLASNIIARNSPNLTGQVYGFDERNRLSSAVIRASYKDGSNVYPYEFLREELTHDALNRLRLNDRRIRSSAAAGDPTLRRGESFSYNDAGELRSAQYGLSVSGQEAPLRTVSYELDKAGNRSPGVSDQSTWLSYIPNLLNQYQIGNSLPVSNGPQHEINGYDSVTYRYIGDQRLASATKGTNRYELGYDALGRCVRRVSNGVATFYIYDGERPIVEYDGNGAIVAKNVYGIGIDEILSRDTGTVYYYHQDRLGSVAAITNSAGEVVEQYVYDAFGTPEIRSGPVLGNPRGSLLSGTLVGNRFLFTGREWAAPYGFYEYRNRAYNPRLGRFMSEDPKGFAAGDRNLYRYCGGDPVNRVDPMGLDAVSNEDGETFHYIMRPELTTAALRGAIVERANGRPYQCAGAAQVLAGTTLRDGLHAVPHTKSGYGWQRGASVKEKSPAIGTLIATGWDPKTHKYLNTDNTKPGYKHNHAGFFGGFLDKGRKTMKLFDQFVSKDGKTVKALAYTRVAVTDEWATVKSNKPYEEEPDQGSMMRAGKPSGDTLSASVVDDLVSFSLQYNYRPTPQRPPPPASPR